MNEARAARARSIVVADDVDQLLATDEALELLAHQPVARAAATRTCRRRRAGSARRWAASHSGLSAGSGSGSVTSRNADSRPRPQLGDERVLVDDRAASDVDQPRAVGQGGEEVARRRGDASRRCAAATRPRRRSTATARAARRCACTSSRAVRATKVHVASNTSTRRGDPAADVAGAEDQHALAVQIVARLRRPARVPAARRGSAAARAAARSRPATASSAVDPPCTPRPLHSVTPSGTSGSHGSTPAESSWITRRSRQLRQRLLGERTAHVAAEEELGVGDARPAARPCRSRRRSARRRRRRTAAAESWVGRHAVITPPR